MALPKSPRLTKAQRAKLVADAEALAAQAAPEVPGIEGDYRHLVTIASNRTSPRFDSVGNLVIQVTVPKGQLDDGMEVVKRQGRLLRVAFYEPAPAATE